MITRSSIFSKEVLRSSSKCGLFNAQRELFKPSNLPKADGESSESIRKLMCYEGSEGLMRAISTNDKVSKHQSP
jgi:hypothetical protein